MCILPLREWIIMEFMNPFGFSSALSSLWPNNWWFRALAPDRPVVYWSQTTKQTEKKCFHLLTYLVPWLIFKTLTTKSHRCHQLWWGEWWGLKLLTIINPTLRMSIMVSDRSGRKEPPFLRRTTSVFPNQPTIKYLCSVIEDLRPTNKRAVTY